MLQACLLCVAVAAAPAVSPASRARGAPLASWALTFSDETVAEHFPPQLGGAIVAADGRAAPAVAALSSRLKKSARWVSLSEVPAGIEVERRDDRAVVEQVKRNGAPRITVVRYFPGGGAFPASVVAATYSDQGHPLSSFAASEGVVYRHPGVTDPVVEPLVQGQLNEVLREEGKRADIERRMIHVLERSTVTITGEQLVYSYTPLQGPQKRHLHWPEFYRLVGRPDLAKYSIERQKAGSAMTVIGGAIGVAGVVGGVALGVSGVAHRLFAPLPFIVGGTGFLGGATLIIVGIGTANSTLVSRWEVRQLASDYNHSLLRGEASDGKRAEPLPEQAPQLQLRFAVGPAGAAVSGTF